MVERKGNRFYPHSAIPAEGTLAPRIQELKETLNFENSSRALTQQEVLNALELVRLASLKEDWSTVVLASSHGVNSGCGKNACLFFYRSWIEALRKTHELEKVQLLALHLMRFRNEFAEFVPLALMALSYCGRRDYARRIARAIQKDPMARTALGCESIATFLAEGRARSGRAWAVSTLGKMAHKFKKNYFLNLNYLEYALENGFMTEASDAFNNIHESFPQCAEPYWGAARLAMRSDNWGEAASCVQEILADNPENTNALLVVSKCMEKSGDLLAARDLLTSSRECFDDYEYEFNVSLGLINSKLFSRYKMTQYRDASIRHLSRALKAAPVLGVSAATLHLALRDLNAGVGEQSFKSKISKEEMRATGKSGDKYWMLTLDDAALRGIVSKDSLLLRCPENVQKGDVVFLSRFSSTQIDSKIKIVGLLKATSDTIPDPEYRCAAQFGEIKIFEKDSQIDLMTELTFPATDAWGCRNFSTSGEAFYSELTQESATRVIDYLEKTAAPGIFEERYQHAV